jgi:hypothetical protein
MFYGLAIVLFGYRVSLSRSIIPKGSFKGFPSYSEGKAILASIKSQCNGLLSSKVIGRSIEGREMTVFVLEFPEESTFDVSPDVQSILQA